MNIKELITYINYLISREGESEIHDELAMEASKLKYITFAVSGALMGYLVTGVFLSVLYYPHFWIICALPLALRNIVNDMVDDAETESEYG